MNVHNCAGECCREFPLNITYADLQIEAAKDTSDFEIFQIMDMVIPLATANRYTCRHWDQITKLCGNYQDRPRMCTDFPYEHGMCHICGSTYCRASDECEWMEYNVEIGEINAESNNSSQST